MFFLALGAPLLRAAELGVSVKIMKRLALVPLVIMCWPLSGQADYAFQGIRTSCSKSGFEIAGYSLINQTPNSGVIKEKDGQTIYFGADKHMVSCEVGKHSIKTEFVTSKPMERGMCAVAPGSSVTIWVDDVLLMRNQLFNNECSESLDKVSFSQSQWVGFVFEICGRAKNSTRSGHLQVKGCFELSKGTMWGLAMPLSKWPLTDMIANKVLQLTPKNGAAEH